MSFYLVLSHGFDYRGGACCCQGHVSFCWTPWLPSPAWTIDFEQLL